MTSCIQRNTRCNHKSSRALQRVRHRAACYCRDCIRKRVTVGGEFYEYARALGRHVELERQAEHDTQLFMRDRNLWVFGRPTTDIEKVLFGGKTRATVCKAADGNNYYTPRRQQEQTR